ncbi:hypothetical protein CY34DRAFT_292818 [Suillus luteus UH-Slu-Lm8-n1]|uniref:Uncharacterized protein n=1 Tax=Suillus luteus UH-Slu-Lm8-n1 TaxID=930992 RepID=A0A0D0AA67_9AGAM|nr:hypothetical protein CY34DRAFT_292818 [Suillus luteus UH-Slu-Lm8-n1]
MYPAFLTGHLSRITTRRLPSRVSSGCVLLRSQSCRCLVQDCPNLHPNLFTMSQEH